MQRLEVRGAVRPIYGSLGVKRLMKLEFSGRIFEKSSNIKFHKNLSSGSRVPCGRTKRHDEADNRISQFSGRA